METFFVSLFSAPSLYIRKEGATHHPDSTNFQFYNETYLIFEVIFLEMRWQFQIELIEPIVIRVLNWARIELALEWRKLSEI